MSVWYNDTDPFVAQWLRNLIAAGHLPAGDVDERPIQEVQPSDLAGYTQCHFFAGIGGWPLALELAGWGDRPVWTGSCPCQPFSAAGKRQGHADERHLWPAWFRLIRECRPATVFGEQVSSSVGRSWFAAVRADLETLGYAVGGADLCAAGVGAPHIRQRLWFVADGPSAGRQGRVSAPHEGWAGFVERGPTRGVEQSQGDRRERRTDDGDEGRGESPLGSGRPTRGVADAPSDGARRQSPPIAGSNESQHRVPRPHGPTRGVADTSDPRLEGRNVDAAEQAIGRGVVSRPDGATRGVADAERGTTERRGHDVGTAAGGAQGQARERERVRVDAGPSLATPWDDLVWLPCRDGKARPTQPGLFPLADGVPGRVGRLRAYGNAIVPQVAAAFVKAYLDGPP